MKIFDTKKTSRHFYELSQVMTEEQRPVFTAEVKELFDKKIISDEGEYDCFKVTEKDLNSIALKVAGIK